MRLFAIPMLALALSACATVQSGISKVGQYMCANQDAQRAAYTAMLINAPTIPDPVVQQAMVNAAQAGLATLSACPALGG